MARCFQARVEELKAVRPLKLSELSLAVMVAELPSLEQVWIRKAVWLSVSDTKGAGLCSNHAIEQHECACRIANYSNCYICSENPLLVH